MDPENWSPKKNLFDGQLDSPPATRHIASKLLKVFKRRFAVFLICVFIAVGLNAWQLHEKPKLYQTHAQLIVKGQTFIPENQYREDLMNFFGTQIALIQSPEVRQRALTLLKRSHPELAEKHTSATLVAKHMEGTTLFRLSASGTDPEYIQVYLDYIIEGYLSLKRQDRHESSEQTLSAITAQVTELERKIQQEEDALQQFKSENNIVFIREQAASSADYLVKLNRELAEMEREYQLIDNYQNLKSQDSPSQTLLFETLSGSLTDARRSSYQQTLNQIHLLDAEIARLSGSLRPEHPKIKQLNRRGEQLKVALNVFMNQASKAISERKSELSIRMQNLKSTIEHWQENSIQLSQKLAEYEKAEMRMDRRKNLYDNLLTTMQSIDMSSNLGQETVKIFQKATEPYQVEIAMIREMSHAALIGLIVAMVLVILIEKWDERIYFTTDIPAKLELDVIAEIPNLKEREAAQTIVENDKRFHFVESLRTMRSYLTYHMANRQKEGFPDNVFAVTSSVPSEGKSLISSNLAISLSLMGYTVLLVDGDMRKGVLHKLLKVDINDGMNAVFSGKTPWTDMLQDTNYENLKFICRGNYADFNAENLTSSYANVFFSEARKQYDIVLMDTSPVLATDDLPTLLPNIDGILFVLRASNTRKHALEKAVGNLRSRKGRIIGSILNACDTGQSSYYKYSYYGDDVRKAQSS